MRTDPDLEGDAPTSTHGTCSGPCGRDNVALDPSGFCWDCEARADEADRWTDAHCPECGWTLREAGVRCPRCSESDAVLEIGVDPGADGAYAWDLTLGSGTEPLASGVVDLGADERKTTTGKVRRLASAEVLADELRSLIAWASAGILTDLDLPCPPQRILRLVAHVELPPAAPGQGSAATASQHRSLGRIEGVLLALGFEVHRHTPQQWRAVFALPKVGTTLEGVERHANQKRAKENSVAVAGVFRPDLAERTAGKPDRAEAVLINLAGRRLRERRETKC